METDVYWPTAEQWDAAIDLAPRESDRLRDVEGLCRANANPIPVSAIAAMLTRTAGQSAEIVGPLVDHHGSNGVIARGGRILHEWGPTDAVDMTFSMTKSFISTMAGCAFDRGLLDDLDTPVAAAIGDEHFSGRNQAITWRHLLEQTSEWSGTLFGVPDVIDNQRELQAPGTHWEYNDVRVNLAALALLRLFGQPLPELFKTQVMDRIGASGTWQWHGYDTSWVELGGRRVQSVAGSGRWGGGIFMSTRDLARLGLLYARNGSWAGDQILSPAWIQLTIQPCTLNQDYGLMWWLNGLYPAAPSSSYFAFGAGMNLLWVDPDLDLVTVVRWLHPARANELIQAVLEAL